MARYFMKLDKVYENVSVSAGTVDVDELANNCFGFLRSLKLNVRRRTGFNLQNSGLQLRIN
jgi:hypothetical protein